MVSGLRGRIPKRDAYIYIYTLSENSVPIMCLALRRSATTIIYSACAKILEAKFSKPFTVINPFG